MIVISITPKDISDFFLSDPKLMLLGLPDEDIGLLYTTGTLPIHPASVYKGMYEEDELVAIVKWELFTSNSINMHIYIKSNRQHEGLLGSIESSLERWLIENTELTKVIFMVPEPCTHVHKAMVNYGYVKEGLITNSFQWRQSQVGLVLYGKDIKRD